jgi:NADH oxidase (H2O-forming)
MKKLLVLYYSRSGNTEKMANAVAEGAKADGVSVEVNFHVDTQDLISFDAIAVGAPTYHHDMPVDFKNLFEEAASKGLNLKGKVAAVFGSYGWSGEAPKLLTELLKNKFGMQVIEPPLTAKYAPDANALTACKELGKKISETLMKTP